MTKKEPMETMEEVCAAFGWESETGIKNEIMRYVRENGATNPWTLKTKVAKDSRFSKDKIEEVLQQLVREGELAINFSGGVVISLGERDNELIL